LDGVKRGSAAAWPVGGGEAGAGVRRRNEVPMQCPAVGLVRQGQ
jgi:hypothetical protein